MKDQMKFIGTGNDRKLYLTIEACVECGMNYRTIIDAKDKETKCWDIIKDPADKRNLLVGYEALNDDRKRKVEVRFGNPYDLVARTPILNMVVNDWKANDYYMGYRFFGGAQNDKEMSLHPSRVYQYTRAAGWLNMLLDAKENKWNKVKALSLTIPEFFTHVASLISIEKGRGKLQGYAGLDVLPGDFPSSYQRLVQKAMNYKEQGYEGLIDPLYGNKNAAKLGKSLTPALSEGEGEALEMIGTEGGNGVIVSGKTGTNDLELVQKGQKTQNKRGAFTPDLYEKQMAVIRKLLASNNNLDCGQVTKLANLLFDANGWQTVSVATVRGIKDENLHLLIPGRRGKRVYMDKVAMQNKRKAPAFPLYYWTLDGWTVELVYQQKGPDGMEYPRMVLVVVLDPVNKYPIGYAIGDRENTSLIKDACRNALAHVYELTGEAYHPLQLQSDHYQVKHMTPFYQAVSRLYTPAEVKNAKAKVIEPYFMYLNKEYCQLHPDNWSGFNLDSKKGNQVNREWLDRVKHKVPDKDGVLRQIERMMQRERAKKLPEYMAKWAQVPEADKQLMQMNEADYLRAIGTQLGERTVRITGQGIEKSIEGVKYFYDSFDPAFRANMHIDWMLYGDRDNLSKVLAVSPDEKLKFVLDEKRILPMDLHSTTQEDAAYRARVKNFNIARMDEITEQYGRDGDLVREIAASTSFNLSDAAENDLKLLLTYHGQQKEKLQDAKGLKTVQRKEQKRIAAEETQGMDDWQKQREALVEQQYDFSQFGR